jgi:Leucine-rich repeat (LRR) protein
LNSIKDLDLSNQMINFIKTEIFNLEFLTTVYLKNNKIEIIEPNELDLKNQSIIYLSNESY